MDNQQEQIIILAQLCANKDMQIFLLNKEKELKEQLSKLKNEENYLESFKFIYKTIDERKLTVNIHNIFGR